MKRSRYSEEQIMGILREAQGGGTVKAVCTKHNISEQTYYGWKRRYGGMDVVEMRKARALEEEPSGDVLSVSIGFFIVVINGVVSVQARWTLGTPGAVLELVAGVEFSIVGGSGLPHLPEDFQSALTQAAQGTGMAFSASA